jgi:hypothetical protein
VAGTLTVRQAEPFHTRPSVLVVVGLLTSGKNHVLVGDELPTMSSLTVALLVAERFGVEVPNVSAWRQATVGDLTSTLGATANTSVPALPTPPSPEFALSGSCSTLSQDDEQGGAAPDVPTNQAMPTQQGTTVPASTYLTAVRRRGGRPAAEVLTSAPRPDGRPVTTKSAYNRLAYTRPD